MAQIKINGKSYNLKFTLGVWRRIDEKYGITLNSLLDDLNRGAFGSLLYALHEAILTGGGDIDFTTFEESLTTADFDNLVTVFTDTLPNDQKAEAIKPKPTKAKPTKAKPTKATKK